VKPYRKAKIMTKIVFSKALVAGLVLAAFTVHLRAVDLDEDGLDDAIESRLINLYRPWLLYDDGEGVSDGYWPSSVTWFVQHSELLYHQYSVSSRDYTVFSREPLAQDVTGILQGGYRAVNGNPFPASTTAEQPFFDRSYQINILDEFRRGEGPVPVGTYARVVPLTGPILCEDYPQPLPVGPDDLLIQYYQLFPFNNFTDGSDSVGDHEGDWLILDVYVRRAEPNDVRFIIYHHHGDGHCAPTVLSADKSFQCDGTVPPDGVPRCYLERGAHEWWHHDGGAVEDCGWARSHNGKGIRYRTENVLNIGEHFAPMPELEAQCIVLYNGRWGQWGFNMDNPGGAEPPEGPLASTRCYSVQAPKHVQYVDSTAISWSVAGLGSRYHPHQTVPAGADRAEIRGHVRVAPGNYPGACILSKPVTIELWSKYSGVVTLGR
jgi:hypothetical protein